MLATFLERLGSSLLAKPEALAAILGFFFTILVFVFNRRKDQGLQQRRNYLMLELEASRIFNVCVQQPEIALYLNGEPEQKVPDRLLDERGYRFVCQCLNIFEIAISLRREKHISADLFATWVSWFHELGTSKRFADYWNTRKLRTNYKADLRDIMDVAVELSSQRTGEESDVLDAELQEFHNRVAKIMGDSSIARHYRKARAATSAPLLTRPAS